MKVRAIEKGFHVTIREPNEEFDMPEPVPSWCKPVGEVAEVEPTKHAPSAGNTGEGDQTQTGSGAGSTPPPPAKGIEAYHVGGGRYGVRGVDEERIGDFTGTKEEAEAEAIRLNAGDPDLTDQDNGLPDA